MSKNGRQVVGIYIWCSEHCGPVKCECEKEQQELGESNDTRMELKFFDLSGAAGQTQTFELEYSDLNLSASHTHVITFSPDLSMLQAGPYIFDLLAPGHPQLSFPSSPLNHLRHDEGARICFSACNGYLAIIEGRDVDANDKNALFGLFRICRTAGKIEKISITGLDDLVADGIEAAFHPTLPLLLLTYVTYRGSDVGDVTKAVKVAEIDLEALKSVQTVVPKHRSVRLPNQRVFNNFVVTCQTLFADIGSPK